MPIYEYCAATMERSCTFCREKFEFLQSMKEDALSNCPECGAPVKRVLSAPAVGRSVSGLDDRAKNAGFTKYKKTAKGEYEKQY